MRRRTRPEPHADWLALVDAQGQFLTIPILRAAFPTGLDAVPDDVRAEARERLAILSAGAPSDDDRWAWIVWLLRNALGWDARYVEGPQANAFAHVLPEHRTELRAHGALIDPADGNRPRVLVLRVPYGTPFERRIAGSEWNASPLDRLSLLARAHGVRIGLVSDGARVALEWIPSEGAGGHAIWPTELFAEGAERAVFASFVSLLHARRFFGVALDDQLERLFERSALAQQDLTKTLGLQVRKAVELLVAAISSVDRDSGGAVVAGIPPHEVYKAAATVMMRLVFLLFAEERGLLPLADPLYAQSYAVSTLRDQLEADAVRLGDEPLERRATAWRRLLAIFGAVHGGIAHDRLRLPAYGGRLFDPARFELLARVRIDDLTIKAILEAIATIELHDHGQTQRRRLSFLALDVEQIGHVYEGLLDHDAVRVEELYVGLDGKQGLEPEVALAELEAQAARGRDALVAHLTEITRRSESAVRTALTRGDAAAAGEAPELRRLVMTACDSKRDVVERVLPFAALLRSDLHELPTIFPPGSLVVKQTRARRDSGTEYTPRSLAEEVVHYALEPLVYAPGPADGALPESWRLKPSDELLALRICDPACGSGAFLVAACRYLSDRVVEAWLREGRIADDDATREAQRAIVERCLYGVDRDGMAVEMAKLSLWLLTFAKERPFGFLDHAIREGDSLLGITSLDQLRYLHLDAERGKALHEGTLFDATKTLGAFVDEATRLRRELESLPLVTVRDAEEKARLNALALSKTAAARTIADALVGIELALAGRPGRERENALLQLADDVRHALAESATESARAAAMEAIERTAEARLNAGRPQQAPLRRPLHWPLEFPEVLAKSESGFDLIAGNPPFLGSQLMTARFGTDYRELLVRHVAFGRKGQSDLVAYFFLCASQIGRRVAMLATNTIAQGDTREIGLDGLVARGWTIVRAERSRQWPGSASLQIAEVWLSAKGEQEPRVLDGLRVAGISPFLYPVSRISGNPHVLAANRDIAFQGSTVLGMGFTMPPVEAQSLIAADPRNAEVLFPYINAEDACSRPDLSASRWIINFQDWGEGVAASYQMPFEKLLRDVRPQRLASKGEYRAYWWRFGRRRPGLYEAIRTLRSVIAMPLVSKYVMPVRLPATLVYAHLLGIFASDSGTLFGILSSNVHRSWAKRYGSTLETRFRYTPTNCFETFPLPAAGDDTTGRIMRELDADRRDLMERLNQGLTTTYNRIHDETERDEAIQELRDRHRALDLAVRDAYGWNDLDLAHGFHPTDEGLRFTISDEARIELLDRLLELNHARHTEEVAQDFHVTARRKTGRRRRDSAPSIVTEPIALPLTAASPTAASLPHSAK